MAARYITTPRYGCGQPSVTRMRCPGIDVWRRVEMGVEASRATTREEFIRKSHTAPDTEGPYPVEAVL